MFALVVTFLAGVCSVFTFRWLFQVFATPHKATPLTATEATSATSGPATFERPAQSAQALTVSLIAHATADSRAAGDAGTGGTGGTASGLDSPLVHSASARSLAKQASVSRSRAAIQVLNEAADILRAQGDALSEAPPSPEPAVELQATAAAAAVAVQRFLSRKLSRQASHLSSSSVAVAQSSVELPGGGPACSDGGGCDAGDSVPQAAAAGALGEAGDEADSTRLEFGGARRRTPEGWPQGAAEQAV